MTTERILQLLIDIFFILLMLAFAGVCIAAPLLLITDGVVGFKLFGRAVSTDTGLASYLLGGLALILAGLFVWSVYRLKKTTRKLVNQKYFDPQVITNFKQAGTGFLIVGLVSIIGKVLANFLIHSWVGISIDPYPNSEFFMIIIGLFFMLFSKILKRGKELAEENDLTV